MNCDITYEELAEYSSGDVGPERGEELSEHVSGCESCQERLSALDRADVALEGLTALRPPGWAMLAARRALSEVTRGAGVREIMTLEGAAEFLRISPEQLGEIIEELPAFELAGQVRVRRERLIEWIQQRERDYTRQAAASWISRTNASRAGIGVA